MYKSEADSTSIDALCARFPLALQTLILRHRGEEHVDLQAFATSLRDLHYEVRRRQLAHGAARKMALEFFRLVDDTGMAAFTVGRRGHATRLGWRRGAEAFAERVLALHPELVGSHGRDSFVAFDEYDHNELESCGRAFVGLLNAHASHLRVGAWLISAKPWTDLVLNWFAHAHASSVVVDTSRLSTEPAAWGALSQRLPASCADVRHGTGEFLKIDLLASHGPQYADTTGYWTPDYWDQLLDSEHIEPLLALESEWKGETPELRYAHVMHSAVKLATVRARAKVLLFASNCRPHELDRAERWIDDVRRMRTRAQDRSPWLVLDVPWGDWTSVVPTSHVLRG